MRTRWADFSSAIQPVRPGSGQSCIPKLSPGVSLSEGEPSEIAAPRPEDTYDPDKWEGRILCSPPERAALQTLLDAGLADCWRLFDEREGRHRFTWWDYRNGGWARNAGLRIDHVLATPALVEACRDCKAHVGERGRKRPSDHVPVVAEFDL